MRILAIQGSPRLNKNTDILLDKFLHGIKDKINYQKMLHF